MMLISDPEVVPQRISWNGILTQAMCIDLGREVLNALNKCDTLAINLDGVESLDHSCLVLLCTVKRQANEKAKKLILEGTDNPVVAALIQRFHSNNLRLCRTYCGHSCLFD